MRDAPAARAEPSLPDRRASASQRHLVGAGLYDGTCAVCHEPGAAMMVAGRPVLPLGTLHEDNPHDTIQIILQGLRPPVSARGTYVPAYADALEDRQVAEIVAYLQARHGPRLERPGERRRQGARGGRMIDLTVNGAAALVDVDPATPLLRCSTSCATTSGCMPPSSGPDWGSVARARCWSMIDRCYRA
jgi:mono/diheme cytochrome c family protein